MPHAGPATDSAYAILNIIDFLCLGAGIYLLLLLHDRRPRLGYLLLAMGFVLLALRIVPDYLFHDELRLYQATLTLSMAMAGVLICWGTLALTRVEDDDRPRPHGRVLLWAAAGLAALLTLFVWVLPFWPSLRAAVLSTSRDNAFLVLEQGLRVAVAAALAASAWITWDRGVLGPTTSRMFGASYSLWSGALLLTATRLLPTTATAWTGHVVQVLGSILIGNALAAHVYHAEREAIERQQRLALIDSVASAAIAAPRLDSMISAATERVRDLLGAAWAATYLSSDDGQRLTVSYRTDPSWGLPDQIDMSADHPLTRAARRQETVRFTHEAPPEGRRVSHAAALPLTGLDGLVGVLVIGMTDGRQLPDADLRTLSNATGQLGIILHHMLLLEHVRLAGDRWRETFDAISDLVTVHDCEGRITAANAAAQQFAGRSEGELIGRLLSEAFPVPTSAAGDGQADEDADALQQMLIACCEADAPATHVHRAHGRVHQIQVMPLRDDEGVAFGCVRVARDVTSRWRAEERLAQSERRYRELAENANDIIYTHDLDGNFLYVNRAAADILGYTREQFSHLRFWDLITPESQAAARAYVRNLLAEQSHDDQTELRFLCADGRVIVVQLRANVIRRAGRMEAIHGIARDVTAEKELSAQLIQADRLASVGTLIAGVAHELNNPLTTIAGYAEMLSARFVGTDDARPMQIIAEEAERCRHVARSLLSFARQTDDRAATFNLNDLVRGVLDLRAYDLHTADIVVDTRLESGLPEIVADYGQVQQVIYNLVDNAFYALQEQGGGTLSVSTALADGRIEVSVADDGPGIPPRLRRRVFEPFFTTKPRDQGTGLGLNICRRIVEAHGGSIHYEDAEPGARFTVTLPVPDTNPQIGGGGKDEGGDSEEEATSTSRPSTRVLFIDDEPALGTLVEEYLGRLGHEVVTALTGEEGLELALERDFDAIICDLRLPGMSGEEVCETLLQRRPQIAPRLIVATGDILSPRTRDFFDRTGLPHVHKPFKLDELAAIVADLASAPDGGQPGE